MSCYEIKPEMFLPKKRIETEPQNPVWRQTILEDKWWARGTDNIGNSERFLAEWNITENPEKRAHLLCEWEKFNRLHNLLLRIGGCETCFPDIEEDLDKILLRGRFWPGKSKMMRGTPNRCHANACDLWERNHSQHDMRICTGYTLSSDGCWRQHSWLRHEYDTPTQHRARTIETTEKRIAYFGFEMTVCEAEEFCRNND